MWQPRGLQQTERWWGWELGSPQAEGLGLGAQRAVHAQEGCEACVPPARAQPGLETWGALPLGDGGLVADGDPQGGRL